MTEIKQFKPSTKEVPKPKKPADIVNIEQAKQLRTLADNLEQKLKK